MRATDYKTVKGVRLQRCGGYVSWDTRKKDDFGYPVRQTREIHVWMPVGKDYADCGPGTELLVATLKAKAEKAGKKNVQVSECWG